MKQSTKREITYWVINLLIFIYIVSSNTTGFANSLKMWIVITISMFVGREFEVWIEGKKGKRSENNQ